MLPVRSPSQSFLSHFSIMLSVQSHINSSLPALFDLPAVLFQELPFQFSLPPDRNPFLLCCSYGLLGPSGCGKTTLLKCIVGTLKISRGHITILGKPPAFPGHEVPGKMVGYMPQVLFYTTNVLI